MSAKILIIDDDDRLITVYSMALKMKYEVEHAPSGKEGLDRIPIYKPDLVITDLMMPGTSGLEVLKHIRNTPATKDLKVIMFTALSDESMKKKAMELGVTDYIVKSQLTLSEVSERVDSVINS